MWIIDKQQPIIVLPFASRFTLIIEEKMNLHKSLNNYDTNIEILQLNKTKHIQGYLLISTQLIMTDKFEIQLKESSICAIMIRAYRIR